MITRLGQLGKKLDEILDCHDDLIIHTGSFQGEKKSIDNPNRYIWNVQNTFKYLEQARKEKKFFVYISTWDNQINPYTASKRSCEKMVEAWIKCNMINGIIIVIPSIIGRGIIHTFLETQKELQINDRELEFLTLEENAKKIKSIILNCLNNKINDYYFKIEGKKISVQLLYDLIKYIKKYKNE